MMIASETTGLLSGCIVDIPAGKDEYEVLGESQKTKSLSLEELMPFQDDPWWQSLRRTFFLSFWITLILIFASACILSILKHGSCDILENGVSTTVKVATDPVTTLSTLTNPGSAKILLKT